MVHDVNDALAAKLNRKDRRTLALLLAKLVE